MKSPIQWTWGSGLRTADRFTWTLSHCYSLIMYMSHYSLLLLPRDRLRSSSPFFSSFFFVFSSPSRSIVGSRQPRNVTFGIYSRAILLATRWIRSPRARVCEKDWYIPDILRFYKMNMGSSTLSYSNTHTLSLSVRFNASPPSSHPWTSNEFSWTWKICIIRLTALDNSSTIIR